MYIYRVTTGHQGSCRVSIPFLRVGVSRVHQFPAPCRVVPGLVMGNVARPGFAGFGVWPGQVKACFAGSGVWSGWVLPGWLTLANTCTFCLQPGSVL